MINYINGKIDFHSNSRLTIKEFHAIEIANQIIFDLNPTKPFVSDNIDEINKYLQEEEIKINYEWLVRSILRRL